MVDLMSKYNSDLITKGNSRRKLDQKKYQVKLRKSKVGILVNKNKSILINS